MKEKKNIDRIFQEGFKDFETEPREQVWDNIASRLDKKEKKRPLIIPLWLKLGGIAAVMTLIVASLLFTDNQNSVLEEPGVVFEKPEKSTKDENKDKRSSESPNQINEPAEQIVSDEKNTESKSGKIDASSDNKSSSNSAIVENRNNPVANNKADKTREPGSASNSVVDNNPQKPGSLNDIHKKEDSANTSPLKDEPAKAIAHTEAIENDSINNESIMKEEENALAQVEEDKKKAENEEEALAETDFKKLRLSTFAAPVFYKNIGSGNELSNQLSDNSTSSEVTLSYGVKVAYQISKKLKIRTGISKIDISNNIQDISYSPSAMSSSFENLSPLDDNVEIRDNSSLDNGLPGFEMGENNSFTTIISNPGEIKQQFGYIEVPLELEYTLIDNKFGLNIIGGGSSLFLDNNRVQLISEEVKTDLGKATNINNTSFSTNIGLGMDYKLTDKFSISVEPIFKYQINTFNNVNNVQPVNFGVYSGLSFRF
ncbi:hypothetical protein [Christiangramia forsetii]|uniref:Outer membrane protein beta-barrel domain-containing protein n=2 Tax=Christiangramia forsetii TaxID=411153 RepID=A0M6E7_CHRFK|nr:hypothetical protein [Christiangramia forsetii]GGG30588.1 hypothetical protein GCM10011532_12650 [Christiangramia forsetii]CAL68192.1 hypothetical protein GFO_3249 [Christiangramia forsetii KT0803]